MGAVLAKQRCRVCGNAGGETEAGWPGFWNVRRLRVSVLTAREQKRMDGLVGNEAGVYFGR